MPASACGVWKTGSLKVFSTDEKINKSGSDPKTCGARMSSVNFTVTREWNAPPPHKHTRTHILAVCPPSRAPPPAWEKQGCVAFYHHRAGSLLSNYIPPVQTGLHRLGPWMQMRVCARMWSRTECVCTVTAKTAACWVTEDQRIPESVPRLHVVVLYSCCVPDYPFFLFFVWHYSLLHQSQYVLPGYIFDNLTRRQHASGT